MSRYSRGSDDGIEDRRFHKKRRILHDVSSNNESLCEFKKANANWNEVLDKSDRRFFSGEMRKFSFGGSEISTSRNSLRQNSYSESHIPTPGSSFFCNSDGDSECITNSFKTRPKFHKREKVLQDDFKTALSRDVTLAQDPSFGVGLESNKSCFIADNSGNFASDNSLDNTCDHRGMRLKYRRHKSKQHSPKERKDFEKILNDVTASEYQSRIVPSSAEDNENEVTNVDLNEVSHFKSNETAYGAPSAITYSTQIVTQTGQFGGMSYVTISEVKERVIIPGRSCPRPMKRGRREGSASEVNYNDNIDNGHGNTSIKSTNSVAGMSIHEEGVAGNQSEILSDFEVESDVLNRSGPRPHYSPLKHSRQGKQRKTKRVISKDVYAEFYEDDSIFNSDINIASPLSIVEMDDSNTYNSTLRSHKAMQNQRNARYSRTKNESYGSSFNDVSVRSNSRRSILREISQNEFELRLVEDDIQSNDHEVSRYRNISENSEKLFLNTMDSVKNVHDNVIEERIKKDMSTEVRKMAKKLKEGFMESNAESDENAIHELDSVPMIIERRQKRRSRSKLRVENEFDTANRDCSLTDSIISASCAAEKTNSTQKERIPAAEKRTSGSHEISRKSRSIADLEENVQNSMILSSNGSKNMSMEVYENDEKLRKEENLLMNTEKPKRRSNRRKRNGSKEFNLTIENASLSSTAESSSMQNSASFMHEKKAVASNSINSDKLTLIEDATPELAPKDKPCSAKVKGNYSKSMLIIDPDLEKEDYSLHLDQPCPRRRRNQVKPAETDEFNVHLEDVSSNVEESISSIVDTSHQLKMARKSSVSAVEILNPDTDHQKISKQGARDSSLTMKKQSSGKTKRSFDQSSYISDNFTVEANSPVMDIVRPKRRSKQLLSGKGDTVNVHLEGVSSKGEESISLVAEASHQSQRACISSISVSSEIPDTADKQGNASIQKTKDDSSAVDQQVNGEVKMKINKSKLIVDANLRSATNYPAINIAEQKRVSNEMQPLKGDDIIVPQNDIASSKSAETISSKAEAIHQSRVPQESAVAADILPESTLGAGNSINKSIEGAALVSTDKTSIEDAKLDNTSKRETADDAPLIDEQVNDETKRNISKSRVVADEEMSLNVDSPLLNVKNNRRKYQRKSVNGNAFNIAMEDISLSNAADSITSIAETSHSEKTAEVKEPEGPAESEDTTRHKDEDVVPAIGQEANDETKGNVIKSRFISDDELSMDSAVMIVGRRKRRRNKGKSVQGDAFNIVVESVSLSTVSDSTSSLAEASYHSDLAPQAYVSAGEIPKASVEPENSFGQRDEYVASVIDEQVNEEAKTNISRSGLILDADIRKEATSPERTITMNMMTNIPMQALQSDEIDVILSKKGEANSSGIDSTHKSQMAQKCPVPADIVSESIHSSEDSVNKNNVDEASVSVDKAPTISVESGITSEQATADDALTTDQHVNDETKRNISKSRVVADEVMSLDVNSPLLNVKNNRRKYQRKSVNGNAFNIAMEDISLSNVADSITSIAETSHSEKSAKAKEPEGPAESEDTTRHKDEDVVPAIGQEANDETKGNISKSRVVADEVMSLNVSSPLLNVKNNRRKYQRKSVNGNAFNIAMEDISLSNAADSITSIAETSHSEKSAEVKEPEGPAESEDTIRHKAEDVVTATGQEANDEPKGNISKSRVVADEVMSLDVNSPLLNVKNNRRKYQRKSVNGNAFNIAMEDFSLSNAADSITSIAETSHSEKSAKAKEPEGPAESEDTTRHEAEDVVPAIDQEATDETKGNVIKSRFILDEELSMDSAVMIVGRRKRRRNKGKSVQGDAFNIVVEGVSSSTASDSILSQAEASCQLEMAKKSSELGHPLLDGCIPDLMKANITIQTLVDGKVAEGTPVQPNVVNENSRDSPQIECSLDNSLSGSKISNVLGNDVAESTRGYINNKWLISEYFGDVSRITDDGLTAKEERIVSVVSAHNKSKKSLDLITNKVETSELPHEALRCKSGGENFALEGFLNFSLEKQTLDSPERVKSNGRISVSPRSISEVVRCDVDLAMPASMIGEGDIAAGGLPEKDELEIIEPPTEIPSKSELSMSLKSSIHNLGEKRVVSCNSDAEYLNKDVTDSRVSVENIEGHLNESIDRCVKSGDNKCLDSKQNENPPAAETTDQESVGKLGPFPEHLDIEKSNLCPSVAITLISEQVTPHASFHKSTQVKTAAETGEKGLMEKVVESPCNLVTDQATVVEEAPSNQNPEKIADDETIATSAVDSPIQNLTNLISEPVSMAPEKISTVQPPSKEPISCTSSTADNAEKLQQTSVHNQSSSKSKNILTDEVLLIQNPHLEIKSSVEEEGKTNTQLANTGSSKEETITSRQPNPTLAPKIVSKLPVPIKHNKGSHTSKSTPLLKNPSTTPPKLVLHASPEKEQLPRKLDDLKSINEETFTILPLKNSSEEADNLFDEIPKDPCESSHSKSIASDLHNNVHKVSRALDSENLNATEQTEVPGLKNTESEKLNLSLSFACLETQGKTSTTINELTFIKTAAPGMTSTPLPSMHCFENMRNTEDVSMLSGISEMTLDQIAAQELLSGTEQQLDPVTKGNLSANESSPAVNELTFIKSNCHLPCIGEEASQVSCDEEQNKEISDNKKSVSVTEPAESSDGKAREIINNSPESNDLRSSLLNLVPCSVEPGVEQEEEKGIHSAKELTFTISAARATLSPFKGIVLDTNERSKSPCASEPVNGIVKSGNSASSSINNEYSEKMVNEISSELVEVKSGGNVMIITAPEVHLNVAEGDAQSNVTVANSNVSSVNKILQNATNLCNPSENDVVKNDTQKPVPHSIVCAAPPDPTCTISKLNSPKTNKTSNNQPEQSDIFNELLLLSPLSTSRWNAICHTPDRLTSMVSSEEGGSEKITSTGNESERCSDTKCTGKSPSKECEVNNSRSSGIAREQTIDSSGLPYLREADVSHLRASRDRLFELNDPRPSYSSDSDKEFRNTEIRGEKINVSGPFCSKNAEGSHLRLSAAVGSKFIHPRPSSSMLSERSSLRPSISNPASWSSVTLGSAKESDGDLTRPGLSSHTSEESSVPEQGETLSTPLRTRYRYFSTPNTAERKAVYKVIDRIDASAVRRKEQQDLIFDTIFPKVVPASKEFKKPRIPPKPKKVQVEDFDEDEEEINQPEKKRRLPVWARSELKTVVTEAIEEQEDNLLDPQDFLFDLVDTIKLVMKSKRLKEVRQGVQKVKQELFNLKLIRTLRDFYQFVRDYFPYEFRRRSIPSSGGYKFNPVWEIEADLDCSLFGSVERIQNVLH